MADNINWTVSIQVPGGPKTSISHTIPFEAYDSIRVSLPKKSNHDPATQEVKVQPDTDEGKVNFLAIMSDNYDDNLTFKVNDKNNQGVIKLNQPLIFAGTEVVGLLAQFFGSQAPVTLFFSNDTSKNFEIWVIVGRNITKK